MVHIVRPVWEKAGQANQMGRMFPRLTYTQADVDGQTLLEPAPRTVRGARDLLSVSLQYGNAFGQGMQAAALKPADYFGNTTVLSFRNASGGVGGNGSTSQEFFEDVFKAPT